MEYSIEEDFIEAVVEEDLATIKNYIEKLNIDPTYDSNLAMRIISEEGFFTLFSYFITLKEIDLSWNNYEFLVSSAKFEQAIVCQEIIKHINKKNNKINNAWVETHIKEEKAKELIKFFIKIDNF
jgi:hypothetical protein